MDISYIILSLQLVLWSLKISSTLTELDLNGPMHYYPHHYSSVGSQY